MGENQHAKNKQAAQPGRRIAPTIEPFHIAAPALHHLHPMEGSSDLAMLAPSFRPFRMDDWIPAQGDRIWPNFSSRMELIVRE